jgi:signal peptidase I
MTEQEEHSEESFADEKQTVVTSAKQSPQSAARDLLSIFGVLISAIILALLLINFIFQSYQVDGPSMQPTLQNADHLIVWKVPKTISKITHHEYIPHRGDVVIFNVASNVIVGEERQLIKRVIGLPGERVVVHDGKVTVYNSQHPDGFSPDTDLPYGSVIKDTPGNGEWKLNAHEIFVMGDHRDNSRDSRDFGPIVPEQIVGKLVVRVLPLQNLKTF